MTDTTPGWYAPEKAPIGEWVKARWPADYANTNYVRPGFIDNTGAWWWADKIPSDDPTIERINETPIEWQPL